MSVIVWSEQEGQLGNIVCSERPVSLSAEEFRAEAEELDAELDGLLDMAWSTLNLITARKNDQPKYNSFEQVWVLGRALHVSGILQHTALRGEIRTLLWQALAPKCWYGVRADFSRDSRWRALIPQGAKRWLKQPKDGPSYRFLEIGYWLREQQLHDAGEVFGWRYSNAQDLHDRASLRSVVLRDAILVWLRRQAPEIRESLSVPLRGKGGFAIVSKALRKRFPSSGPGSAFLPQHYAPEQLQEIVNETLDTARDQNFVSPNNDGKMREKVKGELI